MPPYKVCIVYMRINDCKVNWFQGIKINIIPNFKWECISSVQFCSNIMNMIFPVKILTNFNTKIFYWIRRSLFLLSLILIGHSSFFFLCLKITSSVFLTLSEILLAFSQSVRFFMSRLIYLLSLFTDLLKWSKFVSSAKWWTFQNFIGRFRSLIYIKNKSGPSTEPWATPYFTEDWLDIWPFIETNCFLLKR